MFLFHLWIAFGLFFVLFLVYSMGFFFLLIFFFLILNGISVDDHCAFITGLVDVALFSLLLCNDVFLFFFNDFEHSCMH